MAPPLPLEGSPPLPMEGALPPDLQGTLVRVGPAVARGIAAGVQGQGGHGGDGGEDESPRPEGAAPGASEADRGILAGALHAIELRDGVAVSYVSRPSAADETVFWHAGSLLALPEAGLPLRYDRFLAPEEFSGNLRVPIASHVRRDGADGSRILFSVDDGSWDRDAETAEAGAERETFLRIGEWDAAGDLRAAQAIPLERATWQHDIGVTSGHVVFIESPTRRLGPEASLGAIPYGWELSSESWVGVVERGGDGSHVQWLSVPLCLVTHVMSATELPDAGARAGGDRGSAAGTGGAGAGAGAGPRSGAEAAIELFVCCYDAPEIGQTVDLDASVVGPGGIGLSPIGSGLAGLERWRVEGGRLVRTRLDDRNMEYPRTDAVLDAAAVRYGYCVETSLTASPVTIDGARGPSLVRSLGLLRFDLVRDEVRSWQPDAGYAASEPIFVRAADGHADDEGWLLTVVDNPDRGASDLYVLDASEFGRRRPEAVIHLPERLPFHSHGEWVSAGLYR
jgi:carotenoid cleavage dioxygenase-like enzyme